MFYTFNLFEIPFFTGLDIFNRMFVVPPPELCDHIIFACVPNLGGDDSWMAIGANLQLNRM